MLKQVSQDFSTGVMDVVKNKGGEETVISQNVEDGQDGRRNEKQEVGDADKILVESDDLAKAEIKGQEVAQPDVKQQVGQVAKKTVAKSAKQKQEQDAKQKEDHAAQQKAAEEKQKLTLLSKCEEGDAKNVKKMLKEGVGWDAANADGWSALHLSARAGSEELLKCFLKKGMKVSDKAPNGNNALHFAAQSNCVWCCALLARSSPSAMSEKNSSGKLPIDMVHPGVTGKELTNELRKWQSSGKVPEIKMMHGKKMLA